MKKIVTKPSSEIDIDSANITMNSIIGFDSRTLSNNKGFIQSLSYAEEECIAAAFYGIQVRNYFVDKSLSKLAMVKYLLQNGHDVYLFETEKELLKWASE